MRHRNLYLTTLLALALAGFSRAEPAPSPVPTKAAAPSQADLEKSFEKTMTNAVLSGSYNVTGSDKPPGHDKYTLGSVTRKEGTAEVWIIVSNIQYGGKSLAIPLEIPVKWAGDTAIITVDNMGLPGMGKYTARVMIFHDQYTGIWGSADGSHGGQMWGKIEHPATQK